MNDSNGLRFLGRSCHERRHEGKVFRGRIERWLLTNGGYRKGDPNAFDRQLALDTDTLLSFIKTSQPKLWARHQRNYPANPDTVFLDKFCENVRKNAANGRVMGLLQEECEKWRATKKAVAVTSKQNLLASDAGADITAEIVAAMNARVLEFKPLPAVQVKKREGSEKPTDKPKEETK